ncbi:MAG TPA: thioredoxin-like domain-containing protein [Opitutaceae bacterium]|nr:thioredoxin-like domain-containing protein [Opitutaceae bacterium]
MKTLIVSLAACLIAAVGSAADLSWSTLVNRRELWPAQCTLNRTIKFKQGGSVEAGQTLKVLELQPTQLVVSTPDGRYRFAVKPEDTDILHLANGAAASLSPAQRGLTYATLLRRQELWPYHVTLTAPIELNGGSMTLRAGEKVVLMGAEQDQLLVGSDRFNTSFDVDPQQTDLMEQARRFLDAKDGAPGRFIEELDGKLVDIASSAPASFEAPSRLRYLVFYRGAGWCAPCREFSPSLVKLYNELKPAHPEFEVVFISADHSAAEMHAYAKEAGFHWPAVPAERDPQLHLISPLFGNTIPQLVVTDRHGKVLIDSNQVTRPVALQKLGALVKAGVAAD